MNILAPVPEDAFAEIVAELERQPIPINEYRKTSGTGRSAAFGFVNKRCQDPDVSRLCWKRAKLYKLLLDFGQRYVPMPFTSITVNQDYAAAPHRDKGNKGMSYLVAFGAYQGGQLRIHDGDCSGTYDIRHQPILFDGMALTHSVLPFEGHRYSLVYYNLAKDSPKKLSQYQPIELPRGWALEYTDVEGKSHILKGNQGLPHPLRGRSSKESVQPSPFFEVLGQDGAA